MATWLKEAITDDKSQQEILILAFVFSWLTCTCMVLYNTFVLKQQVDLMNYAGAVTSLIMGTGFGYAAKRFGEKYSNATTDS